MTATRIGGSDDVVLVNGLKYKRYDEDHWFVWASALGGSFKIVHEDEVPDEVWAEFAKRALLSGVNEDASR